MFDLQVLSGVQTNRQEINTRLTKWIIQAQWMTILKVQSWSIADLKAAPLPSTLPTSPVTGQFVWAKHSAATSDVFKNSTYPTPQLKRWHWETSSNKPLCVCVWIKLCAWWGANLGLTSVKAVSDPLWSQSQTGVHLHAQHLSSSLLFFTCCKVTSHSSTLSVSSASLCRKSNLVISRWSS